MQIIADKKTLYIHEAFANFPKFATVATEEMTAANVKNAEVLVVRSMTKVNEDLLQGSQIKMVATASIGTDHIDHAYLAREGIGLASAAGANANAVAEYVIAASLEWLVDRKKALIDTTIGVVGIGNIGSRVVRMARGLGMTVIRNDPPRAETEDGEDFQPLEEILQADIITLHVPRHSHERFGTIGLIGAEELDAMKPDALLINSSRGGVVDEAALKDALDRVPDHKAVIDVWQGEPAIDTALLRKAFIVTPHIAGHSLDGKANCTLKVYEAVCRYLDVASTWKTEQSLPRVDQDTITIPMELESIEEKLLHVVRQSYAIRSDDQALRGLTQTPDQSLGDHFQGFRDNYQIRREFSHYEVAVPTSDYALKEKLQVLGFKTEAGLSRGHAEK